MRGANCCGTTGHCSTVLKALLLHGLRVLRVFSKLRDMTAEPITRPTYLRTGEAARILGVSRDTVVRLVTNGSLSSYQPAGSHRYLNEEEVLAYKAQRERRSAILQRMTTDAEASGLYDLEEHLFDQDR
jgi:excisionase family DNA binding protein